MFSFNNMLLVSIFFYTIGLIIFTFVMEITNQQPKKVQAVFELYILQLVFIRLGKGFRFKSLKCN